MRFRAIAHFSFQANETQDNIGARRLHAVLEKVMDELFFDAPQMEDEVFTIDRDYVNKQLRNEIKGNDLKDYIL